MWKTLSNRSRRIAIVGAAALALLATALVKAPAATAASHGCPTGQVCIYPGQAYYDSNTPLFTYSGPTMTNVDVRSVGAGVPSTDRIFLHNENPTHVVLAVINDTSLNQIRLFCYRMGGLPSDPRFPPGYLQAIYVLPASVPTCQQAP
jgi:hypothetical protein